MKRSRSLVVGPSIFLNALFVRDVMLVCIAVSVVAAAIPKFFIVDFLFQVVYYFR